MDLSWILKRLDKRTRGVVVVEIELLLVIVIIVIAGLGLAHMRSLSSLMYI